MTRRRILTLTAVAAIALPQLAASAFGGEIALPDSGFRAKVASFRELHQSRVVQQEHDFSCGSAAVATLLTYSYGQPTTEREAFDTMYAVGDREHIEKFGFSLLDMQKYLASRGLHAVGYKMNMERLRNLHVPAIVLISPKGYNHFVVVRGLQNGGVIVADPRLGLRRIKASDFEAMWNGIVFVLKDGEAVAGKRFNDPKDLKILASASPGEGMVYARDGLTSLFLNIPFFNDY
jgi:predicted double-glycine peptidase